MVKWWRFTRIASTLIVLAIFGEPSLSAAQNSALEFDGEVVADAKLFEMAKKEGKLVMYSAFAGDALKLVIDAFQADTGIRVEAVRLVSERLYQRVLAEHATGRLNADYIDLTDLPLVKDLVKKGVLNNPYKTLFFESIPTQAREAEGRWYAFYRPVSTIGVNAATVKETEQPRLWRDLLAPHWRSRIGLQSIDVGGSAFTLNIFLRDVYDGNFWSKLAAQKPRIYPGVAPAITDMVRGEISIVAIGSPPLVVQKAQGAPIRVIFPEDGLPSFPVAGGIPVSSRNPYAAKVLLNWLTSKRGGVAIGNTGSYPANKDAAPPRAGGMSFPAADKVWNIDVDEWEKKRVDYANDWRSIFGQN